MRPEAIYIQTPCLESRAARGAAYLRQGTRLYSSSLAADTLNTGARGGWWPWCIPSPLHISARKLEARHESCSVRALLVELWMIQGVLWVRRIAVEFYWRSVFVKGSILIGEEAKNRATVVIPGPTSSGPTGYGSGSSGYPKFSGTRRLPTFQLFRDIFEIHVITVDN